MSSGLRTQYFLGANTPSGFYSLYGNFFDAEKDGALYIIKGGPGCGKSSFMRTIADGMEKEGFEVQYILCSGDPDSIDGIFIPETGTAFVDGTAPHVIEPKYPAAAEHYINLGVFYDSAALKEKKSEIIAINKSYKALYDKAYSLISGAAAVTENLYSNMFTPAVFKTIDRRARGIIQREFKRNAKSRGNASTRFIDAFTCKGSIFLDGTVKALASRVCVIDNDFGLSHRLLSSLSEAALEAGYDVILCPDPLFPNKLLHVIIPELSLAFISHKSGKPYPGNSYKHMRLDSLADKRTVKNNRAHLRICRKTSDTLLKEAQAVLSEAKTMHDRLEAIYNPHVDFDGVYKTANEYLKKLLKKDTLDNTPFFC